MVYFEYFRMSNSGSSGGIRRPSPNLEQYDAMTTDARRDAFIEVRNLLSTIGDSYLRLYRHLEQMEHEKQQLEQRYERCQQQLEHFLVHELEDI